MDKISRSCGSIPARGWVRTLCLDVACWKLVVLSNSAYVDETGSRFIYMYLCSLCHCDVIVLLYHILLFIGFYFFSSKSGGDMVEIWLD
jgi:hypothetical protein